MARFRILVVDDEDEVRGRLIRVLSGEFDAAEASDGPEALEKISRETYDLVLLDQRMPRLSGLEVLREIKKKHPEVDVIMVTAVDDRSVIVECIKGGAEDFIVKPIGIPDLKQKIRNLSKRRKLAAENQRLRAELDRLAGFDEMVGESPALMKVLEAVRKVATMKIPVLVCGESGTGKELIARAIHRNSSRRDDAFLTVNCGAFEDNLLASELFGHVRGAFTDAREGKRGLFVAADGGTLFLDEISETSPSFQVQLLRVLENGEVRPIGSTTPQTVDTRIVAATNKDLEKEVEKGAFRKDLYFRLWQFPIRVPPLRERKEDVPRLAQHFLHYYTRELNKQAQGFSDEAMRALTRYDWPGNVRELKAAVERSVILAEGDEIGLEHLFIRTDRPFASSGTSAVFEGRWQDAKKRFERAYLVNALRSAGGNISRAARRSGIDRKNFRDKMKAHEISTEDLD